MIPEQINNDGSVYFRIFVKPLVNLIWLAGIIFLLGSVIALWPDAREQRRLAVRYDEADSPATPAGPATTVNVALVLGTALAVLCVVLVALPFLREPEPVSDKLDELTGTRPAPGPGRGAGPRAGGTEGETEADHRAGRVNDEDYRLSIGPYGAEGGGGVAGAGSAGGGACRRDGSPHDRLKSVAAAAIHRSYA